GLDVPAEEVAVAEEVLLDELDGHVLRLADLLAERGRVDVVGDGVDAGEPLGADDLLGVEGAVGAAALDVPHARHPAHLDVERHDSIADRGLRISDCRATGGDHIRNPKSAIRIQRFPRRACSRSMASKRALKLPSPKVRAPLRWMIS